MIELLAPAGDRLKLDTAVYFGADAVYFGGGFSLRAYCKNFTDQELKDALEFLHGQNKKGYITVNIFPKNKDFEKIKDNLIYLQSIGVDAVIMSDPGLIDLCKKVAPKLKIHLSTQANTLNKYSAKFWGDLVSRIILARELSIDEIKEIKDFVPELSLEAFVHGAMCISYSGRCLLSNYLSNRDANYGECVQACRWEYQIREVSRTAENYLTILEDGKTSYILNSKDLCLIEHLDELKNAGVDSFKIEGRMKSEYYVATVTNAYKKTILNKFKPTEELTAELYKTGHRQFTTAYLLGENLNTVAYDTSKPAQSYDYTGLVLGYENGYIKLIQKNRFREGDILEVLSPGKNFNKQIRASEILDEKGQRVADAKLVEQVLFLKSDIKLNKNDILRRKR